MSKRAVDLKSLTKKAVRVEIQRLQNEARDYFYAYNKKFVKMNTHTVEVFYNSIMQTYKLSKARSKQLRQGIVREIQKELIARFGQKNVQKINVSNKVAYQIVLENADYDNITRKHKKDNLIKQHKEKIKISIQLERDLRDAMRDYCKTYGVTMSSIVRYQLRRTLEEDDDNTP